MRPVHNFCLTLFHFHANSFIIYVGRMKFVLHACKQKFQKRKNFFLAIASLKKITLYFALNAKMKGGGTYGQEKSKEGCKENKKSKES